MVTSKQGLVVLALFAVIASLLDSSADVSSSRLLLGSDGASVAVYTQIDIERTARVLDKYVPRVLIFDGESFSVHNVIDKLKFEGDERSYPTSHFCSRCLRNVPLFVNALMKNFPHRFSHGSAPFQVMYAEGDCIDSKCINDPKSPDCVNLAPILASTSTPVNPEEMPSVVSFPTWFYTECIYNWHIGGRPSENCSWKEHEGLLTHDVLEYDDLIPTIIWRGSDHMFLEFIDEYKEANEQRMGFTILREMDDNMTLKEKHGILERNITKFTPRWKGVIYSIVAELEARVAGKRNPWIDTKFTSADDPYLKLEYRRFADLGLKIQDKGMSPEQMSRYKYQIDYGGGGGTTWRGTLTKLKMPGVLFHHETRMKDWFYPDMKAWVHYIPVKWDLSDLHKKWQWAEANPEKCKQISERATKLVDKIMSPTYMGLLYDELYKEALKPIVKAYRHSKDELMYPRGEATKDFIIDHYHRYGFHTDEIAVCGPEKCTIKSAEGWTNRIPWE